MILFLFIHEYAFNVVKQATIMNRRSLPSLSVLKLVMLSRNHKASILLSEEVRKQLLQSADPGA